MIEVKVFATSADFASNHTALVKRLDFEDNLKVDCKQIVDSMRCLFGSHCVVDFTFVP